MSTGSSSQLTSRLADTKGGATNERADRRSGLRPILILLAVWIFALVPLLFVRTEWFGRPLSDQQIGEYLHAEQPYLVEHALAQIGDRMARRDNSVTIWYSDLVRLAGHPSPDVRALDATVMGSDSRHQAFRDRLHSLLEDPSRLVRFRAALALARLGDPSGHAEIVNGVQPWTIAAPDSGKVGELARPGAWVKQSTTVARMEVANGTKNLLAPVNGRVSAVAYNPSDFVPREYEILRIDPAPDVIADVLTGLAAVGGREDLALVSELGSRTSLPERVRQQAAFAAYSIRTRLEQAGTPTSLPQPLPAN